MWIKKTFQTRLVQPVFRLLRQGLSPARISACIIVGMVISVFPMYIIPTLLCILVSSRLKLNLPLVQSVNYMGGALQITLFFPFVRLGEKVWGAEPLPFSPVELRDMMQELGFEFIARFSDTLVHAITGWFLTAPWVGGLTLVLVYPWIERISARRAENYVKHHPDEEGSPFPQE